MEEHSEYIEPTNGGRLKMALIAIAIAASLEATKRWFAPAFLAHVHALPKCEQLNWLIGALQVAFISVPLLLTAFMIPMSIRMLRLKQFPLPGAWVWRRRKVQRGRIVVLRAYAIVILCAASWVFPFWARHILMRSNVHQQCFNAPTMEARLTLAQQAMNNKSQNSAPNRAFKPTPTLAMASPFSWPALVPSALTGSGAA